jgi:ATP-dependent exoDNAse (exonuclease V) beta subunit
MNNRTLPPHYTHKDLYEDYMSNVSEEELKQMPLEWQYFIQFVKDTPDLKPYRTEWLIFNEDLKLAGSIDMVYENPDGTLSIYDWKRSKEIKMDNGWESGHAPLDHIPNSNYWHYTLQLNTYRWFLETYYGLKISDMYLIILHPDNGNYQRFRLNRLTDEIQDMLDDRKASI